MKKSLRLNLRYNRSMKSEIVLHGADITEREISDLQAYEVVLAYNLQPPLRSQQGYWWLETLASGPMEAREIARSWIRDKDHSMWECTDWVRPAGPHPATKDYQGDALPIFWSAPVEEGSPKGLAVRDPANGRRLGFLFDSLGEYGLLRDRQAESSKALGWAPLVHAVEPRHSTHRHEKHQSELPAESEAPFLLDR